MDWSIKLQYRIKWILFLALADLSPGGAPVESDLEGGDLEYQEGGEQELS